MTGRKCCRQEPASASSSKKAKRQVTKVTFTKWQREHDREHQTLFWLRCEMDRDNVHLASLLCALCKKYEGHLQSFKSFNAAWITGSTNQKASNVLDHAGIPGARCTKPQCRERGRSPRKHVASRLCCLRLSAALCRLSILPREQEWGGYSMCGKGEHSVC